MLKNYKRHYIVLALFFFVVGGMFYMNTSDSAALDKKIPVVKGSKKEKLLFKRFNRKCSYKRGKRCFELVPGYSNKCTIKKRHGQIVLLYRKYPGTLSKVACILDSKR